MIFVFGSNLQGIHGKGAALVARLRYGAISGVGEGLMSAPSGKWSCYALPTKFSPTMPMSLDTIRTHVDRFINVAKLWEGILEFQVTQVGCGLGGYMPEHIAPMFLKAPPNCLFDDAWRPIMESKESGQRNDGIFDFRYWGTHP